MNELNVVGVIVEKKIEIRDTKGEQSPLIEEHIKRLSDYEIKFMGTTGHRELAEVQIESGEVNSPRIISWANKCRPDVIALFGTSILSSEWTKRYENRILNLHLGSSPRYRGSATLFWPFYNQELEHVATTIHIATDKVDAGAIIRKVSLEVSQLENYYQFTTETIMRSVEEFPRAMLSFLKEEITPTPQDKNQQKYLYRRSDFTVNALEMVLSKYGI
jgi:methionyl-tRNA formyltransferase